MEARSSGDVALLMLPGQSERPQQGLGFYDTTATRKASASDEGPGLPTTTSTGSSSKPVGPAALVAGAVGTLAGVVSGAAGSVAGAVGGVGGAAGGAAAAVAGGVMTAVGGTAEALGGVAGGAAAAVAGGVAGVVGGLGRFMRGAVRVPGLVVRGGVGAAAKGVAAGLGAAGFVGDKVLPAPVMRTVRGVGSVFTGGDRLDASGQAERFIQQFQAAYGTQGPKWVPLGLQQACVAARADQRLIFAYVHKHNHEDVEQFCSGVLSDPALVACLNAHFTCWGGGVRFSDAHGLTMRLGASTYPFVVILSMAEDNTATIVKVAQGPSLMERDALLRTLEHSAASQGPPPQTQRVPTIKESSADEDRRLKEEEEEQEAEHGTEALGPGERPLSAERARQAALASQG